VELVQRKFFGEYFGVSYTEIVELLPDVFHHWWRPGEGINPKVTRLIQVKEDEMKASKAIYESFATSRALSDLPPVASRQTQETGKLDPESLKTIENILEYGKLDQRDMIRSIARKHDMLLTSQEYRERRGKTQEAKSLP